MMVRGDLDEPFVRSKTAGGVRPGLFLPEYMGNSYGISKKPIVNGTYRDSLYIGCHGGPKLKLMCLGMAGVGCWCLHTAGLVHTTRAGHACAGWRGRAGRPATNARA